MMRMLGLLIGLLLQGPPDTVLEASLARLRADLRQMSAQLDGNKATFGATGMMKSAKYGLRAWAEVQFNRAAKDIDIRVLSAQFHQQLRQANLLCDDCDQNVLGYVDDVRVSETGGFLVVITAIGTYCGYDESAYVYEWSAGRWRAV